MALSLASLSKNIDKFAANNKNIGMFTTKIRVLFYFNETNKEK